MFRQIEFCAVDLECCQMNTGVSGSTLHLSVSHCLPSWANQATSLSTSDKQVPRLKLSDQRRGTATMRITLKFLVKALVVLIVLIFALPLFLHHLDSKEWEKMEELARAKRDRAVSIIVHYNAITSKLHVLSYLNSSENIYRYRLHVYLQVQVTGLFFPSVLWRCWLDDRKSIHPVKSWVLVCSWWWYDFALLIAPVVTVPLVLLTPVKSRMETFWYWPTQVHLENWQLEL